MGQGAKFLDDGTEKNIAAINLSKQRTSVVDAVSNRHTNLDKSLQGINVKQTK